MLVSVIVPARDAAATIGVTMQALEAQDLAEPYEVLVVDDGSSDETREVVQRSTGEVRLLSGGGQGAAHARNVGANAARGSALAFTDADCRPTPTWLSAGVRALRDVDLVQGAVLVEDGVEPGPFDRTLVVRWEYGLYESANLFVRRDLFERLGGFTEVVADWRRNGSNSRPMGEDTWFAWRARRAGARTAFAGDAIVHHAVFRRRARQFVAERRRLRHFPGLARKIPELRDAFFFRRYFLSARTARFDTAVLALLVALLARRRSAILGLAPYGRTIAGDIEGLGPAAALRTATVHLTADLLGLASLVEGSIADRSVVL